MEKTHENIEAKSQDIWDEVNKNEPKHNTRIGTKCLKDD